MATANGSTRLVQVGIAAVVILATTITLLGLSGRVQTLDGRVQELDGQVEQLGESVAVLDEVEARIDQLQRTSIELGHFRNDLLAAVCAANAATRADLRRCQREVG
jgi:hypothetical protein